MADYKIPTPTQKPVPSADIRDVVYAGAKVDEWATSGNDTYADRFGKQHLTAGGISNQFQQFLLNSGYEQLADYVDGPIIFTRRNQITAYNGEFYRPKASVTLPFTTTGNTATTWETDKDSFVAVGDAALRQELSTNNQVEITPEMFGGSPTFNFDTGTGPDSTLAFQKAIAVAITLGYRQVKVSASPDGYGYLVSDELNLSGVGVYSRKEGVALVGENWANSTIYFKAAQEDSVCISTRGGSGTQSGRAIRNLSIVAHPDTQFNGILVLNEGTCFFKIHDVRLERGYIGTKNLNSQMTDTSDGDSGQGFCEFCDYQNVRWVKNKVNIQFLVDGGTSSFHGTQLSGQNQLYVDEDGGVGVQIIGTSTTLASCYNQYWFMHFWGDKTGVTCYAIDLQNGYARNTGGLLTGEGQLYLRGDSNNSSYIDFSGPFRSVSGIGFDVGAEPPGLFGKFKFDNLSSSQSVSMASSLMSGYTARPYVENADDNGYIYPPSTMFRVIKNGYSGLAFSCYQNTSATDSGGSFWFGQQAYGTNPNSFIPKGKISGDFSNITSYSGSLIIVVTTNGTSSGGGIRLFSGYTAPYADGTNTLGTSGFKYKSLSLTNWTIDSAGVYPVAVASGTIGTPSNYPSNIYSQNAVTVVSDENYKTSITPISENVNATDSVITDVLLEKILAIKYQSWKLKSAVAEKGQDYARWHVGVLAQDICKAFTDAGLDWSNYGVVTKDSHSQVVRKESDGNYYPVLSTSDDGVSEESSIPVNSSGYIDYDSSHDALTTATDGTITMTRTIYMVRMEEFYILRMAAIESKM